MRPPMGEALELARVRKSAVREGQCVHCQVIAELADAGAAFFLRRLDKQFQELQ